MCFRKPVMFALMYHEDYNKYDLGVDHPLIGNKPRKTMDFFKEKGLLDTIDVFTPKKATEKDLLRVHEKGQNHLREEGLRGKASGRLGQGRSDSLAYRQVRHDKD